MVFSDLENLPSHLQVQAGHILDREPRPETNTASVRASVLATTLEKPGKLKPGRWLRMTLLKHFNVKIYLPPLRQRPEDIPLLAERFLAHFRMVFGRPSLSLTPEASEYMLGLPFLSNQQDLRNLLANVAVHIRHDTVSAMDLFQLMHEMMMPRRLVPKRTHRAATVRLDIPGHSPPLGPEELKQARREAKVRAAAAVDRSFLEFWYPRCNESFGEIVRRTGLSKAYLYKMAKRCGFHVSEGE